MKTNKIIISDLKAATLKIGALLILINLTTVSCQKDEPTHPLETIFLNAISGSSIMKKLFVIFCFSVFATFGYAQNRVEKPLQLHANFSGLFLDIAGNGIADETVDELNVNSWVPGFSLGYHFNRYIYVGYSFYSPLDMTLKESWGLTFNALDANIVLEHQTGAVHSLETRISPFKFGLYASLGFANIGKVDYQMQFEQKDDGVLIGNNSYATDLDINWNSKNINTATLGLGYTYVSKSGFSFNLGISVPMSFPDAENIIINPTDPSANILPSDITLAQQHIQNETFYGPVVMYLNVGYNLNLFSKEDTIEPVK
jgi:hypothetical protein